MKSNLCIPSRVLLHENIARMGVTVYVSIVEDHLAEHLANLPAHVVHVHTSRTQTESILNKFVGESYCQFSTARPPRKMGDYSYRDSDQESTNFPDCPHTKGVD